MESLNEDNQLNENPNQVEELTDEQKEKIERNRLKALEKRNRKLVPHPYAKRLEEKRKDNENDFFSLSAPVTLSAESVIKVAGKKVIDTGGGFLIEEDDEIDKFIEETTRKGFTEAPPPIVGVEQPTCVECDQKFATSYLFETFDYPACDSCRDNADKHALITRTDAQKEYLLKDCDLDRREPPLKFIQRRNPHNPNWGTMKLYLQVQVEQRALEVWGSEDKLREELEKKEEKRIMSKTKKYKKQMKELRMQVRSSLYDKTKKATHEHKFGPESYNEEDDVYSHKCLTCDYEETFEKM